MDVIRPSALAATECTRDPIGVIGTEATIASGAYTRAIAAIDPDRQVVAVACPLLVPIVEEGRSEDDPIVTNVLCDYLRPLQRSRCGALILGCTHYPLLRRAIANLMGPDVALINSGEAAAGQARSCLETDDLQNTSDAPGRLMCYTTDSPERFADLAERFGGRKPDHVQYVGTDELEARCEPVTG